MGGLLLHWLRSPIKQNFNLVIQNPLFKPFVVVIAIFLIGLIYQNDSEMAVYFLRKYRKILYALLLIPVLVSLEKKVIWIFGVALHVVALIFLVSYGMDLPGANRGFHSYIELGLFMTYLPVVAYFLFSKYIANINLKIIYISMACGFAGLAFIVAGKTAGVSLLVLALVFLLDRLKGKYLCLALVFFTMFPIGTYYFSKTFENKINEVVADARNVGVENATSTSYRLLFYKASYEAIRENPLLGLGTGGFKKFFYNRYPIGVKHHSNPHNEYVSMWVQFGLILGSIVNFYLFFIPIFYIWKRRAWSPYHQISIYIVVSILVGSLFQGLILSKVTGMIYVIFCMIPLSLKKEELSTKN